MSDQETFPEFLEELDPDEEKEYEYVGTLKPNAFIVTSQVDIVDPESKATVTDSPVQIVLHNHGVKSGRVWGVKAYLLMTSTDIGDCAKVYLRFRLTIDETPPRPLPLKIDQTWAVKLRQR